MLADHPRSHVRAQWRPQCRRACQIQEARTTKLNPSALFQVLADVPPTATCPKCRQRYVFREVLELKELGAVIRFKCAIFLIVSFVPVPFLLLFIFLIPLLELNVHLFLARLSCAFYESLCCCTTSLLQPLAMGRPEQCATLPACCRNASRGQMAPVASVLEAAPALTRASTSHPHRFLRPLWLSLRPPPQVPIRGGAAGCGGGGGYGGEA